MVAWGDERPRWSDGRSRCGDCGVAWRGFHHLGCDVQQCAVCGGQMITCGCRFDEDGPDEDEDDDDLHDDDLDDDDVVEGVIVAPGDG